MSTVQSPAPPRKDPAVEYVEYDKYIDRQVERTRRAVKLVDLAQSLLVLVIGLLAFLLVAAVLEHWVFAGGLSTLGRMAMFALLVGGLGYYVVRYVWPLLASSINPAYAAAAIEREHPTLKNALLNFLLFRSHKQEMPAAVYEALEEQAARRLSVTSIEDSIDRSTLVKSGVVLLAVIVLAAAYASLSPKSSLDTAARVLMPWANIAAPSRVRIESIEPGDAEIVQGETVTITANVFGLGDDEVVEVSYDSVDGHRVDQRATMQPANDAGKFAVTLPADGTGMSGLDQDLTYRIMAGDGRSIDFTIRVLTAPHIRVRSVHYDFPEYTGYQDRTIEGRGDIRAIEGTKVSLRAEANTDIDQAFVDLASDGKRDKRMLSEGQAAQVELPLRLEGDRRHVKTSSYMLRYTSTEGLENHNPPQHTLEILPDYPPEVEVLQPEQRTRDVQVNETVSIAVEGRDPDFALRTVMLKFAKEDGTEVHEQMLLKDGRHEGRYDKQWDFTPVDLGLKPGEIVEYWAEATDVRSPQANRAATDHKQFRIVGDPNQQQGEGGGEGNPGQGAEGQGEGQHGQDGNQGEGEGAEGEGKEGQGGEGQGNEGQGSEGQGKEGQGNEGQGDQKGEGQDGEGNQGQGQQNGGGQQGQGDQQNSGQQKGEGQQGGEGQQQAGEGQQDGGSEQQQGGQSDSNDGNQAAGNSAGQQDSEGANGAEGQRQGSGGKQSDSNDQPSGAESGQQSEGGEGDGGENSKPVASDGSDDASAFEKIQRQLNKDEQQNATRQQKPGGGDPNSAQNDKGEGQADAQNDAQRSGQEQASGEGDKQDNPAEGQSQAGDRLDSGDPQQGSQQRAGKPDGQQGTAEQREAEGSGADTKNDAPQSEGGDENSTKPEAASESAGGEERNASGDPGAGSETESQGAPDAQEEMKQRDKTARSDQESESDETEPPTPGHSKHESDSQGEQGGDRAGGGEEGGGQKAPREGTGSAGQNQAADEGAGESGDQGPGEAGQRGGDSQQAEGQTGKPGQEKGNGSQSRPGQGDAQAQQAEESGQNGQQGTEQQAANQQGRPSDQQQREGQDANQPQDQQQNPNQRPQDGSQQGGNQSSNNGQAGGNDGSEGPMNGKFDGTVAEGDKANLEYTRKQTDLILDKLSDQLDEGKVDQEMLDDLGWSKDDLRQFVDRWNRLRAEAERPNSTGAKQELDARLRSLGPTMGTKGGTRERTQDDFRNLREGYSGKVPLKYRDRLKAYTEGVSKGQGQK
ncbi:hypothetical protein NG895_19790 [Aeoliella sp. ICT_H6.2]|uniref:Uncharacterized protein n=1 Tax=Aeoliella straminimaris TaxID=2954799 RepID=A0A9X2FDD5_9BACT|nr:hypothetical protein [Aeoliella straminimaris]MCO6046148.1 hypothetical protein [Aeoliella straminimaris]